MAATGFDDLSRVDFRNPIPLDAPLHHEATDGVHRWRHGDVIVIERRSGSSPDMSEIPGPVDLDTAMTSRKRGEARASSLIGECFSCGFRPDSLGVHAGPVGDGRFATPYTPPPWTATDGFVHAPFVWAPLDCASGWAVVSERPAPVAVTATLCVETVAPVVPEREYVVVATAEPEWRARRKQAWAAMYTTDGELTATAESLWVKLRTV
jgi:acyl-coenzyme A thioesterase PaaI-like protein